ncbi:hypothetical protein NFI96_003486 [Prochilodus magdalenae]|nr:hypothetical protein NFI96_003486 [Prochilodus magdalenae]
MAGIKRGYDGKIAGLYDLDKTLGRGHFAVVKLARHVFTGEKVAVKVIDKTKLDTVATGHLFQEVRCMKLVQHPNIVRLYEVIDTQTKLYLILELGDGGDMFDYIMKHEEGLTEDLAKKYFAQIVHAISYCHRLHVVHRDLKPENVVFFEKQGLVKLTDFGFSNKFQPGKKLTTSCGSLAYSAPEILLGDEYDAPAVENSCVEVDADFARQTEVWRRGNMLEHAEEPVKTTRNITANYSNIWSLGVILFMLVCGQPPFQEANDSETLTMIMDCKYTVPTHVSNACKDAYFGMYSVNFLPVTIAVWLQLDHLDSLCISKRVRPSGYTVVLTMWLSLRSCYVAYLINRMLQRDPKHRASLEEIEGHAWLQGVDPSPATKFSTPLVSHKNLSEEEHNSIIQRMVLGDIADRETIIEALETNKYNHITATYFLLAERILREKQEKEVQPRSSSPSNIKAHFRQSWPTKIDMHQDIEDSLAASSISHAGGPQSPARSAENLLNGHRSKGLLDLGRRDESSEACGGSISSGTTTPVPPNPLKASGVTLPASAKQRTCLFRVEEDEEEEEEQEPSPLPTQVILRRKPPSITNRLTSRKSAPVLNQIFEEEGESDDDFDMDESLPPKLSRLKMNMASPGTAQKRYHRRKSQGRGSSCSSSETSDDDSESHRRRLDKESGFTYSWNRRDSSEGPPGNSGGNGGGGSSGGQSKPPGEGNSGPDRGSPPGGGSNGGGGRFIIDPQSLSSVKVQEKSSWKMCIGSNSSLDKVAVPGHAMNLPLCEKTISVNIQRSPRDGLLCTSAQASCCQDSTTGFVSHQKDSNGHVWHLRHDRQP